jgi:cellulose synthase/poly-beta-1,6-N-acetylglucosamine synthase-like glycosyltransferase
MPVLNRILLLFALVLSSLVLRWVCHDFRRLAERPRLVPSEAAPDAPPVSVLIPARNEERNIVRCVHAACTQHYPNYEVLVVDDGSTDRTGALLAALNAQTSQLSVLTGRALNPGWTGKCNVCQQLAEAAQGEWLLFLDADTTAQPGLVAALLDTAERKGYDLLSIYPFMELGSFWERAVLPPFIAMIHALYPTERIMAADARPDEVIANGQCIFVKRAAYFAAGGHAAVRGEVLEDVKLAQQLRRSGFRIGAAEGLEMLSVRMYRSGSEVREGLTKNAAAGARSSADRTNRVIVRLLAMNFGPFWAAAAATTLTLRRSRLAWPAWASSIAATASTLLLWRTLLQRLYRQPVWYALLWPFGFLTYLLIALWGMWRVRSGRGVVWKGRSYEG